MFITAMGSQSRKKSLVIRVLAICVMTVILLTSAFSVAALGKTAVINVDGQTLTINTASTDVNDILETAGVNVGADDLVNSSTDNNTTYIDITRAFEVILNADGSKKTYHFAMGTVADVLDKAGIVLSSDDTVEPSETTELSANMEIKVTYGVAVTVTADGKTISKAVPQGTVQAALDYLNIKLGKDDKINVKLTDAVKSGMKITVNRITYKDVKTVETVSYKTVKENSDQLEKGTTKVTTKGTDGEKTITTRQTLTDGKVTAQTVTNEEVTKEAVDEKVLVGTKASSSSETATEGDTQGATASSGSSSNGSGSSGSGASSNYDVGYVNSSGTGNASGASGAGIPESCVNGVLYDCNGDEVSYSTVHHGSGTAYYAEQGSLTASGNLACVGGVAVNPNIIPLGSKLFIVADDGFVYGYATAIDTGGALYEGSAIVDVFYWTLDECSVFGRRDVNVYVLS